MPTKRDLLTTSSLVLDTACSSSLYCLHVACAALEAGECDAAIVAGANLVQSPEQHIGTMKAGVLSATSTCHTFDASADGYGRADGVSALYVKRLDDAIRDGDPVRSVIRASAINANGRTNGITLPSADGQEAVTRKAYAKAGLDPVETSYVECHGTGTKVGDAIEVEGVSRVFQRPPGSPLYIGSVKTNVGHSEAASGVSSVIKATLALEKSQIPGTVGLKEINPKLKIDEWNMHIPTQLTPWPVTKTLSGKQNIKRASVNSFGYGGANAHVIIEDAQLHLPQDYDAASKVAHALGLQGSVVLPLSAATAESLDARLKDLSTYDFHDTSVLDLAHTLGSRRSHLRKRGYMILDRTANIAEALGLKRLSMIPTGPDCGDLPFAYVFTGQGSQWPEMCKELFTEFSIFRDAISEMDAVLQSLPHPPAWTLREQILLDKKSSQIHHPTRSQPTCTAIQVALVQLLAQWDIYPSAAIGHSSGEIGAAFAAGLLTAAEAITIAYYRGYVVSKPNSEGGMMAAGLAQDAANTEIAQAGLEGQIRVACVNSPESVTISGDANAIDHFFSNLQEKGSFVRKLNTGGQAYHSHHMQVPGKEYQAVLEQTLPALDPSFKLAEGAIFVSSVTNEIITEVSPAYWRSNLESPVLFAQAVERLSKEGSYHLIELGPHSALQLPIKQIRSKLNIPEENMPYNAAIKRFENALESVLHLAGSLWLAGHKVSFDKINGLESGSKKQTHHFKVLRDLPNYKWHYNTMLWSESRSSIEFRNRKYQRHELLGSQFNGGNGVDLIWRNVVKVDDIPWLQDHKLEETVVLPGAGYLSMAMEATLQASNATWAQRPSFHIQNVNILSALALSTEPSSQVELFTTIRRTPITYASTSGTWWEFNIASFQDGQSTTHASGSVSLISETLAIESRFKAPEGTLEPTAPRVWYENLQKQGLNFGPTFRSIEEFNVSRMKSDYYCSTKAPLQRTNGDELSVYAIHPITIDAMLQSSIIATTAGVTKALRGKVPTRIGDGIIKTPDISGSAASIINSFAESTGFGSARIGAELIGKDGEIYAKLENVRLARYETTSQVGGADKRHPMLRVLWKPDVYGLGMMRPDRFTEYLDGFVNEAHSDVDDEGLLKMAASLNLLTHKNPTLKILELGNDINEITDATLDLLLAKTDFKRLSSYTRGTFNEDGELVGGLVDLSSFDCQEKAAIVDKKFDLILLPFFPTTDALLDKHFESTKALLEPQGLVLALAGLQPRQLLQSTSFDTLWSTLRSSKGGIALGRMTEDPSSKAPKASKYLVVDVGINELSKALMARLRTNPNHTVSRISLEELEDGDIASGTTVFSLIESQRPVLATATNAEMRGIKQMTDNASTIVWVTNGNLLQGESPDFALVNGVARALVLEQPSLKFFTYDVDDVQSGIDITVGNLLATLDQKGGVPDLEFVQHHGVTHISRFLPDDSLNVSFRLKQGSEYVDVALKDVQSAKLAIESPGQFDTIYFEQLEPQTSLGAKEVSVTVKSFGFNAKDFYALAGKVDTKNGTCCLEFSGIVENVGSEVSSIGAGDRVVVMAPSNFQTLQVVPEWSVAKLRDDEDFHALSTLGLVFATAIYGLHDRAHIQPGESVLIHSGAGGVGIAAIQIAKLAKAEIFTTVSSDAKKAYLVEAFGIKPENVFTSRDTSFLPRIMEATKGRGVDIVLNSLTGDLLHASWKCCASYGRFVEIGKLDLTTGGKLSMEQFLQNVTFTAFDVSDLYNSDSSSHHALWARLLGDVLRLYRERKISKIEPLEVFDISDLTQALRHFSSRNRMGKIAISLENPESRIRTQLFKYTSSFSADKWYVMIGCLGGLGRSMSKWIMSRGGRKFVFLGRSGTDKAPARRLIEDLEYNGAICKVVRGDVCSIEDVKKVVKAVDGKVGGVIQAAMGLNVSPTTKLASSQNLTFVQEALFTTMSNEWWHTGIDPKVQGTWNLHNAIKGKDSELDFFLMTSSISGSVGTATESNYCSGNYFLDIFARYRRSQGLPATSIGLGMISEVGYLHNNPEIEALLLRKGIQAINEDELLQITDISLSSDSVIPHAYDSLAHSHVLTGLEPHGLKELRKKGFEGTNPTLNDPRAAVLAAALDGDADKAFKEQNSNIPVEVSQALEDGASLSEAVLTHVTKRFGNLVLLPFAQVDITKPLATYGMDSMIAAEFRTWFFQSFQVDIPFLTLLSKSSTLTSLSKTVVSAIEEAGSE